jgi:hypothetical protein
MGFQVSASMHTGKQQMRTGKLVKRRTSTGTLCFDRGDKTDDHLYKKPRRPTNTSAATNIK